MQILSQFGSIMDLPCRRETPVGYALLKAKSSKILNENDFSSKDASAEEICNLYVLPINKSPASKGKEPIHARTLSLIAFVPTG